MEFWDMDMDILSKCWGKYVSFMNKSLLERFLPWITSLFVQNRASLARKKTYFALCTVISHALFVKLGFPVDKKHVSNMKRILTAERACHLQQDQHSMRYGENNVSDVIDEGKKQT